MSTRGCAPSIVTVFIRPGHDNEFMERALISGSLFNGRVIGGVKFNSHNFGNCFKWKVIMFRE